MEVPYEIPDEKLDKIMAGMTQWTLEVRPRSATPVPHPTTTASVAALHPRRVTQPSLNHPPHTHPTRPQERSRYCEETAVEDHPLFMRKAPTVRACALVRVPVQRSTTPPSRRLPRLC